jgi:hypothetical protein
MNPKTAAMKSGIISGPVIRYHLIIFSILLSNIMVGQHGHNSDADRVKGFRASVIKINITPDNSQYLLGYSARMSAGVHDSIFHRVIALDDGMTQFYLISTEICIISPAEYDRVAAKIKSQLGIDPMNLWWSTTHTHSAPECGKAGLDKIFMGERYQHEFDSVYTDFVEQKWLFDGFDSQLPDTWHCIGR